MSKTIKIKDNITTILSTDNAAIELFRQINELTEENIGIDFREVEFMSISFALEYVYQKEISKKNITEINLLEDDKRLLTLAKLSE